MNEISDSKNLTLTPSQQKVLNQLKDFISPECENRVFILKGYAGTGKTTMMRFLVEELKNQKLQYHLLASTGRAAKVLTNLTDDDIVATTVHSLIYSFNDFNKDFDIDNQKDNVDELGQLYLVFGLAKLDDDCPSNIIYIIDEASMISDVTDKNITQAMFGTGRLLKELLDYDKRPESKFIFVGDPCQLPPISETISPALMPEYFENKFGIKAQEAQLKEIMRQGSGSTIVTASQKVRKQYQSAPPDQNYYFRGQKVWGMLPFRNCNDIIFHKTLDEMLDDYVEKVKENGYNDAIFISRSNRRCRELSYKLRSRLGFNGLDICKNDLMMVIQNNLLTGLMNGDLVKIIDIGDETYRRANLTFRKVTVQELFTSKNHTLLLLEDVVYQPTLNLSGIQQTALFEDFFIRMSKRGITQKKNAEQFRQMLLNDPFLNALRCNLGYTVTCHKAQGGEWNNVYIDMPRNITFNPTKESYQWVYTAMTRAKEKLHLLDDFFYSV